MEAERSGEEKSVQLRALQQRATELEQRLAKGDTELNDAKRAIASHQAANAMLTAKVNENGTIIAKLQADMGGIQRVRLIAC